MMIFSVFYRRVLDAHADRPTGRGAASRVEAARRSGAPVVIQGPDSVEYDPVSITWDDRNSRWVLEIDWPNDDDGF